MYFRNLTMMRFPRSVELGELDQLLPICRLRPVGPHNVLARGFVSPLGRAQTEPMFRQLGSWHWLCVGIETRVLPSSAVDDEVDRQIQRVKDTAGRLPGARERKRLREDVVHAMLPDAPVKSSRVDLFLDASRGVVFVDTASPKAAEATIADVRAMLAGSFPAVPLHARRQPRSVLTGWVGGDDLPDSLTLGEEAVLRDPEDGGAVVRLQHQELLSDEVALHLESGKQAVRLALRLADNVSFVLGEDLVVRKLKFLDGALSGLGDADADDLQAELDARFALQVGELGRLFDVLAEAFGIEQVQP